MEELLNKLIEKGWKPRGENNIKDMYVSKNNFKEDIVWVRGSKGGCTKRGGTFRELVSKESGLWQFVCENGIANTIYRTWDKFDENDCPVPNQQHLDKYYEYRLIESALCDEDNLEQFLLENIKVE